MVSDNARHWQGAKGRLGVMDKRVKETMPCRFTSCWNWENGLHGIPEKCMRCKRFRGLTDNYDPIEEEESKASEGASE